MICFPTLELSIAVVLFSSWLQLRRTPGNPFFRALDSYLVAENFTSSGSVFRFLAPETNVHGYVCNSFAFDQLEGLMMPLIALSEAILRASFLHLRSDFILGFDIAMFDDA